MTRKRKTIDDSPVHNGSAPRADNAKDPVAKKRRVDWSTVDDFPGFTVSSVNLKAQKKQTIAAAKKLKNGVERKPPKYPGQDAPLDAYVVQSNPFPEADLSEIHVKISPAFYWESTNRYRKFTINGEEFQVGQVVFVKNSDAPEDKNSPDSLEGWLAKVLEVRAGDSSHVYLRVFWVYRPEDLPCGRQPHHGANEVIVSNHMDIIEALTVQSSAEMVYWNDDPDNLPLPADRVFFRQSFDVTKKGNPLSKLNKNCIDNQPINPDELLVQCSHCSEWLPARSLEQQAIRNISSDHKSSTSPPKKRGRPNKRTKSNGDDSTIQSSFDANLTVSNDGKTRLTITDNHISEENKESRQWDVDIICLKCGKGIEKDEDGLPSVERKDSTIHVSSDADKDNGYENGTTTLVIRDGDKTLIKDDGADSVIDNQDQGQDAEMKSAPPNEALSTKLESAPTAITEMTETKAPKKRGRPPGSTKRKRASTGSATSLATESSLPRAKHAKLLNPIKEENTEKENIVSTITATQDSLTNPAQTATLASDLTKADAKLTATSPQSLTSESVFESGVRSVKRLLWN